jgi:two-component system chemotaxis sensor kinase CheA
MDADDEYFMKKLKSMFLVEAREQLQKISDGLMEIENSSGEQIPYEIIDSIFREAHNLKGSARAVNHVVIQSICQALEGALSELRKNRVKPGKDFFNGAYSALDIIEKYIAFEGDKLEPKDENDIQVAIEKLNSLYKSEAKQKTEAIESREIAHPKSTVAEQEKSITDKSEIDITPSSIRVSTTKLDSLLQQIEETLMVKLTSKQRAEELKNLFNTLSKSTKSNTLLQKKIHHLRKLLQNSNANKTISIDKVFLEDISDMTAALIDQYKANLDIVNKLSAKAVLDNHVSESIIDALFENTKKVLMHPFGSILESFPRMVRDIAKSLNKEIVFSIEGKNIEIDKRILEEIKDPLMHLIRNSIDHGIESPQDRIALNKPEKGIIKISAVQTSGNYVEISISDDGAGIDIEKLKSKVAQEDKSLKNELDEIDEENVNIQLFQPGISTKETVTEISGRGIGLGVVREQVEKLKGSVTIRTKLHEGTTFIIKLPLALATFRGLHIQVRDLDFIIPSHNMRKVLMINSRQINTVEGKETLQFAGKHIPYHYLGTLLDIEKSETADEENTNKYIVIIEATGIKIALGVDQIFSEQEIFVKPLGKLLRQVKYIHAATIMEWGKVIPILDPFELVKSSNNKRADQKHFKTNEIKEIRKYTILVVEDNMTARALIRNILGTAGYHVETAVDGLEAFMMLMRKAYDLVVSDIQMPHMDGFELTKKIRENETTKNIPVILCSSLTSNADRLKGDEAGANAYIAKGNFDQSNLLKTIKELLKG